MVELAMATHLPLDMWETQDDATIATALTVLEDWNRRARHG